VPVWSFVDANLHFVAEQRSGATVARRTFEVIDIVEI